MSLKQNKKIILVYHFIFYETAYSNYFKFKEITDELDKKSEKREPISIESFFKNILTVKRHILTSIIFSALTLEAYINHYGISNFTEAYFNNYLDKLSAIRKWVIIPRLVTGKQINTDSQGFENLKWLFNLRNKLVHFKSIKCYRSERFKKDLIKDEFAEKSIKTVHSIIEELIKIDNNINLKWIDIIEKNVTNGVV